MIHIEGWKPNEHHAQILSQLDTALCSLEHHKDTHLPLAYICRLVYLSNPPT